MKIKIIIACFFILSSSCGNRTNKLQAEKNVTEHDTLSILKNDSIGNYDEKINLNKVDSISYSFVLSCGSGCALTYDLRNKRQLNNEELELKFHVTTYINEKVDDEHFESYIIKHNKTIVNEIYGVDDKEILLEEESPNLFFEIKKLSGTLIGNF